MGKVETPGGSRPSRPRRRRSRSGKALPLLRRGLLRMARPRRATCSTISREVGALGATEDEAHVGGENGSVLEEVVVGFMSGSEKRRDAKRGLYDERRDVSHGRG